MKHTNLEYLIRLALSNWGKWEAHLALSDDMLFDLLGKNRSNVHALSNYYEGQYDAYVNCRQFIR